MKSFYRCIALLPVISVSEIVCKSGVEGISQEEIDNHLAMGNKMLAAGQLSDALSHYHAAVEGDPNNYLTYYRRATVYLALGKSKAALPDLDKVVDLKPDFTAARLQRGNVKLKQGKLDEAYDDYQAVLFVSESNAEARRQVELIDPLREYLHEAQTHIDRHEHAAAVDVLSKVIEHCPWDAEMREKRADSYIAMGDYFKAVGDMRPTVKLIPDNTAGYLKLSNLYYQMGEADTSLGEIRECLKLDPDHKECFKHYKKVKKLVKQMESVRTMRNEQRWEDCVNKANQMLKTEGKVWVHILRAKEHICHCQSKAKDVNALNACNEVLKMDENNLEALCDRAEAHLTNEAFQEAVNDYRNSLHAIRQMKRDIHRERHTRKYYHDTIDDFKKATSVSENYQRAQEGVRKAEKLLKQSKKRDYYKILGVKRSARKTEILKAYRKLAVQWHPDKFEDEAEKKNAEKKFIEIAAAKEVLTDPEKRQKFDQGEDPLDPEQQGQSAQDFWNGFNPFGPGGGGGGGFNFKFHFN